MPSELSIMRNFEKARAASLLSDRNDHKLGSVMTLGNKVLAVGYNITKTHPIQKKYNIERTFNYEENYLFYETIITTYILFKIQSPEWIKRTRNLDSVVW